MTKNLKYKNPLSKKVKNDILGQLLPFQKKIKIFDLKKLHPDYNICMEFPSDKSSFSLFIYINIKTLI